VRSKKNKKNDATHGNCSTQKKYWDPKRMKKYRVDGLQIILEPINVKVMKMLLK